MSAGRAYVSLRLSHRLLNSGRLTFARIIRWAISGIKVDGRIGKTLPHRLDERVGIDRVLNAAALTYVAAAITTLLTLLYYLMRAGIIGGRDE